MSAMHFIAVQRFWSRRRLELCTGQASCICTL